MAYTYDIKPREKKQFLVDMDGVLCNYQQAFNDIWNTRYPERQVIPLEQMKTFYIQDIYPKEYQKDIQDILDQQDFFKNLPLIEGAKEGLEQLAQEADDVRICTSPRVSNKHCIYGKVEWVYNNLGEDWVRKLIITKDKTLVKGDYLIDDKPKITGSQEPTWEHILFDQPYNREGELAFRDRFTWTKGFYNIEKEYK